MAGLAAKEEAWAAADTATEVAAEAEEREAQGAAWEVRVQRMVGVVWVAVAAAAMVAAEATVAVVDEVAAGGKVVAKRAAEGVGVQAAPEEVPVASVVAAATAETGCRCPRADKNRRAGIRSGSSGGFPACTRNCRS